jgi:hypothetical protein
MANIIKAYSLTRSRGATPKQKIHKMIQRSKQKTFYFLLKKNNPFVLHQKNIGFREFSFCF